jgi:hypothetical protein
MLEEILKRKKEFDEVLKKVIKNNHYKTFIYY